MPAATRRAAGPLATRYKYLTARNTALLGALLEGLRNAGYLRIYGWIGVGILLVTLLLTLFDRHFDPQFPRRWRDGLAESFYAAVKIATAGQVPGRTNRLGWLGRVWQGVWLLPAIALVAFVILDGNIRNEEELVELGDKMEAIEITGPALLLLFAYDYLLTAIWYWGWIRWGQPRWQARKARTAS